VMKDGEGGRGGGGMSSLLLPFKPSIVVHRVYDLDIQDVTEALLLDVRVANMLLATISGPQSGMTSVIRISESYHTRLVTNPFN
jgi:hypothetical protein